ncbi:LysR family transcriptional regulator [Pigmentiphaga soli]
MNFDIEGLKAFIKVAEFGSFHQAADGLFVSHSALSRRLSKLEAYLGVRLLDRTTRRVELTAVGRNFLPQARDLVEELERSFSNLRKIASRGEGQIVLASIPTVSAGVLPAVIESYTTRYPDNRIRILDLSAREVLNAVLHGEAEFGLSLAEIVEGQAESELLLEDRFIVACHPDHPLAACREVSWPQLRQHRVIAPGLIEGNRPLLDNAGNKILRDNWHIEIQRFSTGAALAERNVGVLIVPEISFASLTHRMLVKRALKPRIGRNIVILTRRATTLSPAAREFIDLLRDYGAQYREARGRRPTARPRRPG